MSTIKLKKMNKFQKKRITDKNIKELYNKQHLCYNEKQIFVFKIVMEGRGHYVKVD